MAGCVNFQQHLVESLPTYPPKGTKRLRRLGHHSRVRDGEQPTVAGASPWGVNLAEWPSPLTTVPLDSHSVWCDGGPSGEE